MKLVHLTDLRGETIPVNTEHIVLLRPPGPGERAFWNWKWRAPQSGTALVLLTGTIIVRESIAEIEKKLAAD
jgi:hypothetical protein